MAKPRRLYGMISAATLLAAGAFWYFHGGEKIRYTTGAVTRTDVKASISATGNSNAVVTVQVGSQVSGNIQALYADFNTKVTKGQLVAVIEPEVFQARVNQAQAGMDASRSAVANAEAQVQKSQADIASAKAAVENQKANVSKAQVAVNDAQTKYQRREELAKSGMLAKEELDTFAATLNSARADLEAAKSQLAASQENVTAAEAQKKAVLTQVAAAQAQVRQNQATLQQAQLDLAHTKIFAPVDGTVVARHMDVGQTVAASFQAPTIFDIAQDLTQMQVDTNVDEADIGRVVVGQAAEFTVDAYPGKRFDAQVSQIRKSPINTQNVITYDVVITVNNSDLKLFPGMTANVKILTSEQQNALAIPNSALRFRPASIEGAPSVAHANTRKQRPADSQTVYVLGQDGKPRRVTVQLGISDGNVTVVKSGDLKEGDRVITGTVSNSKTAAAPSGGTRGARGPGF
jgi:HlyD family secretion protein